MDREHEWRDVVLADLAAPTRNALVGGPFGSDLLSSDYSPTGVPVIRGENLASSRWVHGPFAFISPEKAARLSANTACSLDIVFTQRGANHYRQVAIVPATGPARFVISQSQMKLSVDRHKIDPLFGYYLFRSPEQQAYLRRNAIQTGVPHTNLAILKAMPLRVPPLVIQRAIARVLGAFDDKIELNRRMNETLETAARTLFKSWFVDFDPVRFKANGRQPSGMDAEVAKLFPSEFEESELGQIPRGWRVGRLDDLAVLQRGFDITRDKQRPGRVPVVSSAGIGSYHDTATQKGPGIVLGRKGVVGSVWYVESDYWPHDTTLWVKDFKNHGPGFVYYFFKHNALGLAALDVGSANPTLNRNHVHRLRTLLPPAGAVSAYDNVAAALLAKQMHHERESGVLASLRDALLPRLLSGELTIPNAERFLAASS